MPETTYYFYDAGGERVRKATYRQAAGGATPSLKSERLYLGALEIYREYDGGGALSLERETLHVTDGKRLVALIETRTAGQDAAPPRLVRYQHGNGLNSSALELDEQAEVISYEEYFPFGSTSYQAVRKQTELPKRYRYTGKERDEESGLYHHGARYYAPWLGRWASCDPAGPTDDINLYAYVSNRPTAFHDPRGTDKTPAWADYFSETVPAILKVAKEKGIPVKNARYMMIQAYAEQSPGVIGTPSKHGYRMFNAQPEADLIRDKDTKKIIDIKVHPGQESEGVHVVRLGQKEVQNGEKKDTTGPIFSYDSAQRSVEHTVELFDKRYGGQIGRAVKDPKSSFKQYAQTLKPWATEKNYPDKVFGFEGQVTRELKAWLPYGIKKAEQEIADLNTKIAQHEAEVKTLEKKIEDAKAMSLEGIIPGPGDYSPLGPNLVDQLASAKKSLGKLQARLKAKEEELTNLKEFQAELSPPPKKK
jgi:RHS repeat-associated protein